MESAMGHEETNDGTLSDSMLKRIPTFQFSGKCSKKKYGILFHRPFSYDNDKFLYTRKSLPDLKTASVTITNNNGKTAKFEFQLLDLVRQVKVQNIDDFINGRTLMPPRESIQMVNSFLKQDLRSDYVCAGNKFYRRTQQLKDIGKCSLSNDGLPLYESFSRRRSRYRQWFSSSVLSHWLWSNTQSKFGLCVLLFTIKLRRICLQMYRQRYYSLQDCRPVRRYQTSFAQSARYIILIKSLPQRRQFSSFV